jgi:histidinol-phosphate aminotransferase
MSGPSPRAVDPTLGPGVPPVRDDLREVVPYGAPQLDVPVRLNTNETPVPPPPGFLAALAERLSTLELNRYPDRDAVELRSALAAREGLPVDCVWAANGSNEVLLQLMQAYGGPGRSALIFRPGYSMYPELCRTTATTAHVVDLEQDGRLSGHLIRGRISEIVAAHDPVITLLANPNNPTGALIGHAVVRELHDAVSGLVVVDEAYIEFAPDGASVRPLLDELPRLAVSRTFSKAFRLAGLRLGYLLAPEQVVLDLLRVRLPYHLDAITQLAGLVALEQEPEFLDHRQETGQQRDRMASAIRELPGVDVLPSAANFLLLHTERTDVFDRLLERGVLVRDLSSAVGRPGTWRVTVGTPGENDILIEALRAVLEERQER